MYLFGVEEKKKIATVANKIKFLHFGLDIWSENALVTKKAPWGGLFKANIKCMGRVD